MSPASRSAWFVALAAVACASCGKLEDVTNVRDLRVLAVKTEPAGFLVDLDQPGAATADSLRATLTALVVDPNGQTQTLSYAVQACPDYIDTITAATGQSSKLCPPPDATSQIPAPIGPALTTTVIFPPEAPATVSPDPMAANGFEYHPQAVYGLTPEQVGLFFSPQPTGQAALDQSIAYNRDFGLDAIVNLTFTLGSETVTAIKRIVYWPRLAADEQPNRNPTIADVRFFRSRNADTGDLEDEWVGTPPMPVLSQAAGDKLFVLPVPANGAVETNYLLRVKNTQTNQIETRTVDRELLNFQFYTDLGTFSPFQRQTELDPFVTAPPSGRIPLESEYHFPSDQAVLPGAGTRTATIWIVAHDERAGVEWRSRTIQIGR